MLKYCIKRRDKVLENNYSNNSNRLKNLQYEANTHAHKFDVQSTCSNLRNYRAAHATITYRTVEDSVEQQTEGLFIVRPEKSMHKIDDG